MPLAAGLLLASWLAGAGASREAAAYSTPFLVFHVGLVLAAFAGLTLAAAMSGLYLFEERRLKHRRTASVIGRMPSLVTLDALAARTVLVALPALAAGVGLGLVRLRESGGSFDALMGASLLTIAVYAAYLLLRLEAGWRGRRAAYLALAGFALVIVVRLALPLAHFA